MWDGYGISFDACLKYPPYWGMTRVAHNTLSFRSAHIFSTATSVQDIILMSSVLCGICCIWCTLVSLYWCYVFSLYRVVGGLLYKSLILYYQREG